MRSAESNRSDDHQRGGREQDDEDRKSEHQENERQQGHCPSHGPSHGSRPMPDVMCRQSYTAGMTSSRRDRLPDPAPTPQAARAATARTISTKPMTRPRAESPSEVERDRSLVVAQHRAHHHDGLPCHEGEGGEADGGDRALQQPPPARASRIENKSMVRWLRSKVTAAPPGRSTRSPERPWPRRPSRSRRGAHGVPAHWRN